MSNFRDLLREAKEKIGHATAEEVHARLAAGEAPALLDVREDDEFATGVIPGAITLSRAHFESRVEDRVPDKDAEVIVYCQSGVRSAFAARTMQDLGYTNVRHL